VAATVFNYRRFPAVAEMRALIASGSLGRPLHCLVQYQSDYAADPDLPHSWRYVRAQAGAGALLDVGTHAIDMARFLVGEVAEVVGASTAISIPDRPIPLSSTTGHAKGAVSKERRAVENEDLVSALLRFENGCHGLFSASRVAVGFGNCLSTTVACQKGTVSFDTSSPGGFKVANFDGSGQSSFRTVANRPASPYVSDLLPVPHDGVAVGYAEAFGFMIHEFLSSIAAGRPMANGSFADGLRAAEILGAIEEAAQVGTTTRVARSSTADGIRSSC
jgi:predicted dehydrogenase